MYYLQAAASAADLSGFEYMRIPCSRIVNIPDFTEFNRFSLKFTDFNVISSDFWDFNDFQDF